MSRAATHRLIDAAATLNAEERALLSLLITHGFDDDMIARATHADAETIAARHGELISSLSSTLGLPPAMVTDAVEELRNAARAEATGNQSTATEHGQNASENAGAPSGTATATGPGTEPPSEPPAQSAGDPTPAAQPAAEPTAPPARDAARRPAATQPPRTRLTIAIVLACLVAIVVVVVVALSTGSSRRTPATQTLHGAATLTGLAGGPVGVGGSVQLVGTTARPRLVVSVSGLPPSSQGYYEVWLYTSILDSMPLARLSAPTSRAEVALPSNFRHYLFIDVSFQPNGTVNHSGYSVLRAPIPQ